MSVAVYSDDELAGLWHRLGGDDEVGYALLALGTANRAAYMLTYQDCESIERVRLESPARDGKPPVDVWSCADWVGNLLYNCVSNAGRNLADERAAETLRAAAAKQDAASLLADATGAAPQPAFGIAYERLAARTRATVEGIQLRNRVLEQSGPSDSDGQVEQLEEQLDHLERLKTGLDELAADAMHDVNYIGHPMHY
jgi:hypothetical protein